MDLYPSTSSKECKSNPLIQIQSKCKILISSAVITNLKPDSHLKDVQML